MGGRAGQDLALSSSGASCQSQRLLRSLGHSSGEGRFIIIMEYRKDKISKEFFAKPSF
jgi:hypothetical protein